MSARGVLAAEPLPGPERARTTFLEERRRLVARDPKLQGLDRVTADRTGDAAWRLTLHFLTGPDKSEPVPPGLGPAHVILLSPEGERLAEPRVAGVARPAAGGHTAEVELRFGETRRALEAMVAGTHSLVLAGLPEVDRFFARAPFSFGLPQAAPAPEPAPAGRPSATTAPSDFLARDYESFRTLMLDAMSASVPAWTERNPTDLGVAIVEVLAYAADYLCYYQDAVSTEAYLMTARRRISLRRHGRLVDYFLDEGCNARVWVQVEATAGEPVEVPRGTQLLTRASALQPVLSYGSEAYQQALGVGTVVFETLFPLRVRPEHHRLELYAWGAQEYGLPAGATSAALAGHFPALAAGEVLILEETAAAAAGRPEIVSQERRHAVRLAAPPALGTDPATGDPYTQLEWFPADALPFALPVAAGRGGRRAAGLAAARGNLVLADQGRTVIELLPPAAVPRLYRPALGEAGLVFRALADPARLGALPAAAALEQDPALVLPAVSLSEIDPSCDPDDASDTSTPRPGAETWLPRRDLLASDRFARDFVVEMSDERRARLRFGDGRYGRQPAAGSRFEAYYRIGDGAQGNIGADSIAHVVSDDPRIAGAGNPLPARGGRRWESAERARLAIPNAFHSQRRCVTADDFAAAAARHPQVLAAAARLRWTGSWTTAFVYLQRRGAKPADQAARRTLDPAFERAVERLLSPLLVADTGLALRPPQWVALDVALTVTHQAGQDPGMVARRLEDEFSDRRLAGGATGFFYPDNFTFGRPVYLSDLIERASEVPGVTEVAATRFERHDTASDAPLRRGLIEISELEIAMLHNDPALPQLGTIAFTLEVAR